MKDKEKNIKLVEKYKKMSYEQLEKLEKNSSLPYEEHIIISITQALKEEEAGIEGIPMEEAFNILLEDYKYKANRNKTESIKRFG